MHADILTVLSDFMWLTLLVRYFLHPACVCRNEEFLAVESDIANLFCTSLLIIINLPRKVAQFEVSSYPMDLRCEI